MSDQVPTTKRRVQTPTRADGTCDGPGTIIGQPMTIGNLEPREFNHVRLDKSGLPVRIYPTASLIEIKE